MPDQPLDFERLLTDPLIRLVRESDGVTAAEFVAVLVQARDAIFGRGPILAPNGWDARKAASTAHPFMC